MSNKLALLLLTPGTVGLQTLKVIICLENLHFLRDCMLHHLLLKRMRKCALHLSVTLADFIFHNQLLRLHFPKTVEAKNSIQCYNRALNIFSMHLSKIVIIIFFLLNLVFYLLQVISDQWHSHLNQERISRYLMLYNSGKQEESIFKIESK